VPPSPPPAPPLPPPATARELQQLKHERDFRKARRASRAKAEEISELNIVAMMDMMTIILVFLLKSYSASSINVNINEQLKVPVSSTQVQPQENISVTVSLAEVAVNDRLALHAQNGTIPVAAKEGGKRESFYVGALYDALKKEVDKQKYIAERNKDHPFTGRVNVIADRRVPYRTIIEVLYTAGQAELGEYKLMVMKQE
jgi:biopolymer transport protein ExbD